MNYTRMCFDPWFFRIIHAGGMICPCCASHDRDYGDLILDYLLLLDWGENVPDSVFENEAIYELKRGLLSGELSPMCQNCFLVPDILIPTDKFVELLEEKFNQYNVEFKNIDYARISAIKRVGIGITNKCNLRCIYCNQSVLAQTNPYFKMDFPKGRLMECLEMLWRHGCTVIETGAFGEATLNEDWEPTISAFHKRHPEIKLKLVTNLSREYSEREIELLASHDSLIISIDTLELDLFSKIRKNGNLPLILKNIHSIEQVLDQREEDHSKIVISSVICNLTWQSISTVSEFAFSHGFSYVATNLELREQSIAYRDHLLQPLEMMSTIDKKRAGYLLRQAEERAKREGLCFLTNGDLIRRTENAKNRFVPSDNPIYKAYFEQYPKGTNQHHLDVVYDMYNKPYNGIKVESNSVLELKLDHAYEVVFREVFLYMDGEYSHKYRQVVFPDYRKTTRFEKNFVYAPNCQEKISAVLLQVLRWRVQ